MTKETVTKVTFSTDEVQAIRIVHEIISDLCESYCWDSDYDCSYIQDTTNEKRIMGIKNLEKLEEILDDFMDFIFDDNKIQIVEE